MKSIIKIGILLPLYFLMLVEISNDMKTGYIYTHTTLENNSCYKIISEEQINNLIIYKFINREKLQVKNKTFKMEQILKQFTCPCGNIRNFDHLNKLPEDGWEELIDYWSCHDSEFRTMLDRQMRPRNNGVLFTHFYLIFHKDSLCCFKNEKQFYNCIFPADICHKIIMDFFDNHFLHNNIFIFRARQITYEIKFFEIVYLQIEKTFLKAYKIGFKESKKIYKDNNTINDYFSDKIFDMLTKNSLNINIMNFTISYIY